jgi:cytochrome c553
MMKKLPLQWPLLLLISITANTYAAGDPAAGQEKSSTCQGCHGVDGNSYAPNWPNLAGQDHRYIIKQLQDFQSGARKNETMTSMAASLSKEDITDIAAYFSQQKLKTEAGKANNAGRKLYVAGNRYTKVPACASCHGPNGVGNGPGKIPRLAGQKVDYTVKQLQDFRASTRSNDRNSIMQNLASRLTDKEIQNVAAYLAGMGAPKTEK